MSTRINTNTTAMMAANNLSMNSDKLSQNIQRLSSGLRINSAADDPSGLVISENMQAQIVGLTQATSNSNDADNMIKTAEGALSQVQSLMMSMRQLALHASNLGVNDTTDIAADQTQINSALQSINRIAATTSFGTKLLLNGSASSAATTTAGSATASAGASVNVVSQGTWSSGNAYNYGTYSYTAATGATETAAVTAPSGGSAYNSSNAVFSGSVAINGTTYNLTPGTGSSTVNLTTLNTSIAASGYQASISGGNLVFTSQATGAQTTPPTLNLSGLTVSTTAGTALAAGVGGGYTAGTVGAKATELFNTTGLTSNATALSAIHLASGGTLTLNDQGAATATAATVAYTAGESLSALATAVASATSGFTDGAVALTATAGGGIQFKSANNGVDGVGAQAHMAVFSSAPSLYADATTAAATYTNGANSSLQISDGNGHSLTSTNTQVQGGTQYFTFNNGLILSSTATATAGYNGTISTTAGTTTTGNDLQFQIGANEGQTASIGIQSVAANQLGGGAASYTDANGNSQTVLTQNLQNINVSTFKGAQDAVAVIDQAISQISSLRSNLGAFQTNVLESNVTSLNVANQNLQASKSTITDTNLSTEIVDYTKNQILVQAGTSALAQANQAPQAILKLLQ